MKSGKSGTYFRGDYVLSTILLVSIYWSGPYGNWWLFSSEIEKGEDFKNMLFLKGKHLAEGLRYIADKHNVAVITATQTDKAVWGANDIDLKNIPESKAIAETADTVFAIIRNPEMKKNNVYRLKIMKKRDGEHKGEQIRFKFNTTYLTMEDDELVGSVD